jgi:hypothetical protein
MDNYPFSNKSGHVLYSAHSRREIKKVKKWRKLQFLGKIKSQSQTKGERPVAS